MKKYLTKKMAIYLFTFFIAVTIDWLIPRLMPGDPINHLLARFAVKPEVIERMREYISKLYGFDKPLWEQYIVFWANLFKGDLGISVIHAPKTVMSVLMEGLPYTLGVLVPGLLASWIFGNWFGAFAARKKILDAIVLPLSYVLMSAPYFWFGMLLVWIFALKLNIFPFSFAYSQNLVPGWNISFILDYIRHWTLPFLSLFLVSFGGWAIGMRNMIIYELEANYSRYLEALGAKDALIRKYAYRNAILPQVSGLSYQIGLLVSGNILLESVFAYPGIGFRIFRAVYGLDFFLIQGGFLFLIVIVLMANFIVDIVYVFIDPRIRSAYTGTS